MIDIDEAIGRVENLYKTVTGRELPAAETATVPIPAERDPIAYVEEQVEKLLGLLALPNAPAPAWTPPLTAWEDEAEIVVHLDVAGASRELLDVKVQNNVLFVRGERLPAPLPQPKMRLNERPLGAFQRVIALPPGVRGGEMTAQLREGVLEIRVPRERSQPNAAPPRSGAPN